MKYPINEQAKLIHITAMNVVRAHVEEYDIMAHEFGIIFDGRKATPEQIMDMLGTVETCITTSTHEAIKHDARLIGEWGLKILDLLDGSVIMNDVLTDLDDAYSIQNFDCAILDVNVPLAVRACMQAEGFDVTDDCEWAVDDYSPEDWEKLLELEIA